jgi:hypothetical protein
MSYRYKKGFLRALCVSVVGFDFKFLRPLSTICTVCIYFRQKKGAAGDATPKKPPMEDGGVLKILGENQDMRIL